MGVFKKPTIPTSPRDSQLRKPLLEEEKKLAQQDFAHGSKGAHKRDAARRKSTGTDFVKRNETGQSNVPEGIANEHLAPGNPPRRNRRSSGFLSLLGYVPRFLCCSVSQNQNASSAWTLVVVFPHMGIVQVDKTRA